MRNHLLCGGRNPAQPPLSKAQQLLEQYAQRDIDFLLGVGGASVLDTCKAVAMGLYGGGPIWDYFTKTRPVTGAVPVGCVLTIAAAGSETSDSAVLTNEALSSKRGCSTPFNRPLFAIMDPETTYTLSPYQTACGVADIMLHTMERYFGADARRKPAHRRHRRGFAAGHHGERCPRYEMPFRLPRPQ